MTTTRALALAASEFPRRECRLLPRVLSFSAKPRRWVGISWEFRNMEKLIQFMLQLLQPRAGRAWYLDLTALSPKYLAVTLFSVLELPV